MLHMPVLRSCGRLAAKPCPMHSSLAADIMRTSRARGHRPFLGQLQDGSEAPIVMCLRCGSYTETGFRGCLTSGAHCPGRMSKGSAHRASRFKRGLHPKRKEEIHGPWPGVPALEVLLTNCLRQGGGDSPDSVVDGAFPKAADQKVIAEALHADFNDPEGPEGRPDEPEVEPVVSAFEAPPEEGFMWAPEGLEGPPPDMWDMEP